mgnify:CR=1 FL=1
MRLREATEQGESNNTRHLLHMAGSTPRTRRQKSNRRCEPIPTCPKTCSSRRYRCSRFRKWSSGATRPNQTRSTQRMRQRIVKEARTPDLYDSRAQARTATTRPVADVAALVPSYGSMLLFGRARSAVHHPAAPARVLPSIAGCARRRRRTHLEQSVTSTRASHMPYCTLKARY